MATAATAKTPQIDIRTPATHTIRLGASLTSTFDTAHLASVRFSHKAVLSNPDESTTSITSSGEADSPATLSLKDGDDEYTYNGLERDADHIYVLIPDENGDGYTLEKLTSAHDFNLTSTPWEADVHKLSQQYPQLGEGAQVQPDEDLFGDEDVNGDAEPDPDNPFDFRHYVDAAEEPPQPSPALDPQRSTTATPVVSQAPSKTSTPIARPAKKTSALVPQQRKPKPKPQAPATDKEQSQTKRVRLSPEVERTKEVPTVRLDRRASTKPALALPPKKHERKASVEEIDLDADDDDDGLVLEGDDLSKSASRHQAPHSLGLALSGQLGEGPISLRSAASSPASRINSPMPAHRPSPLGRNKHMEDEEIHLGGSSPEPVQEVEEEVEEEKDADAAEDADDDVEEMQLPSPAQTHRPSMSGTVVTEGEEGDDDLEKQMMMAMMDDYEGGGGGGADEEEESEEE